MVVANKSRKSLTGGLLCVGNNLGQPLFLRRTSNVLHLPELGAMDGIDPVARKLHDSLMTPVMRNPPLLLPGSFTCKNFQGVLDGGGSLSERRVLIGREPLKPKTRLSQKTITLGAVGPIRGLL